MMRQVISGFRVVCFLALLLTAGVPCGYAIEPAAENFLLRGDWQEFLQVFGSEEGSTDDPIARFLVAHANGAIGRNHVSDSLFNSMTDRDQRRWLAWTDSLQIEHPQNYIAVYLFADARFRLGRWAESISGFSSSLKIMRDHFALVLKARGTAWAEKNRDSAAIADFSTALETNPDDAVIYYRRGRSYAHAERYEEAILDFDTALRLDRRLVLASYYKAVAIDEAGGFVDAVEAYQSFVDRATPVDSEFVALAEQTIAELEEAIATGDTLAVVDSLLAGIADSLSGAFEVGISIEIDSVEFMSERREETICDVMPSPISVPESEYPDSAAEAGITGIVELRVLVGPDGKVVNVMANSETGVDSSLIKAATNAATEGEWEPGQDNEQPAPCWVEYTVEFAEDGEVTNNIPEPDDSSFAQADSVMAQEPPQPMFIPEPEYPDSAMEAGITGVVQIKAFVDKSGGVREAVVIEPSEVNVGFEKAASESARGGRWQPAMENGEPIMSWVSYKVEFSDELRERQKERELALQAATDSAALALQAAADSAALALADSGVVIETDTSEFFPAHDEFVEVDEFPTKLHLVVPDYPDLARQAGLTADVWVRALVDKKGHVRDAVVEKASVAGMGFEEAALAAAKQGKWTPAMQNDQHVACWVSYKIKFSPDMAEQEEGRPPELKIVSEPVAEVAEDDSASESQATDDKEDSAGETEDKHLAAGIESIPQPIDVPLAEFPKAAADSGMTGIVTVKALINRDGRVGRATVERDPDTYSGFEEAVTKAAMKGKWKPAIRKGNPVPYPVQYQVEFTAEGKVINHIEYAEQGESESEPDAGTERDGDSVATHEAEEDVIPAHDDSVVVDREPMKIFLASPDYPEKAREAGVDTDVWVRVLIDKDGNVRDAIVEKASVEGIGFEQKAIEAAMKGKWTPAMRDGKPIYYWFSYKIKFTLED